MTWASRRSDPFPIAVFRRERRRKVHLSGLHAHDFFTLLVVTGGSGVVRLVGRQVRLHPGDVHLLPPGEPHDTNGLLDIDGWVVEFTGDALGSAGGFFGAQFGRPRWFGFERVGGIGGGKISLPEAVRAPILQHFETMARELSERAPAYQDAARALLQLVLIEVSRAASRGSALPPRFSPLVEEVFNVIDRKYMEPLNLSIVARAVGRSPSYVTNRVRRETRLTVLEWITERRLDEARRRLRDSDEDVAIIAERVGYGTVDHFIRQFRRAHGMPPGAWRRALQPGTAQR